jgi:hypothetical protein
LSVTVHVLLATFLAGVLAWQLASGVAMGAWWCPRVVRRDRPVAYWLVVALQGGILIAFVLTGRTWHTR